MTDSEQKDTTKVRENDLQRRRLRRLLHSMGASKALEVVAGIMDAESLATANAGRAAFVDAAPHAYRASTLLAPFLIRDAADDHEEIVMAREANELRSLLGLVVLGGKIGSIADAPTVSLIFAAKNEIVRLRKLIDEQAKQVGRLNDLKARLDVVEGEVKKTSDEHTAARAELREHADKAKTHDPVRKSLLSELHEVLIEQVPDIALSMSADEVVKLAAKTVENLAKRRDETHQSRSVVATTALDALRDALLAHTKDTNPHDTATGFVRQAADVIAKQVKQREQVASIIEANAAPLVVTDKLTGHPIGCEAYFAGVRFHCHKTSFNSYEDRKQSFVIFEVYATTELDREAIAALRSHADQGTVAPLHAPPGVGIKGYGRITSWPASSVLPGGEVTFQFELHSTKEEGEQAIRRLFTTDGHADQAKVIADGSVEMIRGETVPRADDLYPALVDMMALLWKARFHAEPTDENTGPAAEFVNDHHATLEKLANAFADPITEAEEIRATASVENLKGWLSSLLKLVWRARFKAPGTHGDLSAYAEGLDAEKFTSEHRALHEQLGGIFDEEEASGADLTDEEIERNTLKMILDGGVVSAGPGTDWALDGGPRTSKALRKLAADGRIEQWTDGKHICWGNKEQRAKLEPKVTKIEAVGISAATSGSIMADGISVSPHAQAYAMGFEPFVATPENDPTPSDAEIMAATLKIIDGGTVISTYEGGPPAGGPRTEAALKKLAEFGTIERWQEGKHTCYGSRARRVVEESSLPAHASPFEGKPFDETDPRNQVHALLAEHGSYGKPFGKSVTFTRDGLLINGAPSPLSEAFKLTVALLELEQQAPADLKGHGFTDATMLSPVPSGSARSHVATCLAYAGLLHELRQALQRSLSGLAISARYNAEQSGDSLAYWTAELARQPIPAPPVSPAT